MALACPHCDHPIDPAGRGPGRPRTRCPGCNQPYALTIPSRPELAAALRPAPTASIRGVASGGPPPFALARTNPDPNRDKNRPPAPPDDTGGRDAPPADVHGFRVERVIGRGGMGTVYLARQLSLDRPVALKVMGQQWSADPVFAARFTREAYAAAQLAHPNIVQIYDIGEADGCQFFSMEYVPGTSLAEIVREQGKLDPETAVGYVLQAARGLKHAHDRGMIHRDVKPDNLLLDEHGIIKVADLGLVKETRHAEYGTRTSSRTLPAGLSPVSSIPRSEWCVPNPSLTGARIALGTPAYMSPEQCRDAATVDRRADVYSLGCTLYVLLTGRPPFDGMTAVELMTKHAYEPIVPPEEIVHRVPKDLSGIIQRMLAKDPAERFQTMGEVVRTLEGWLGVRQTAGFAPSEDQIGRLESFVAAFNTAPSAVLRDRLVRGFYTTAALAAVLLGFFSRADWAAGVGGLVVQASLAYFVIDGVTRRSYLFTRVKQFVWGLAWGDWAVAAALLVLAGILLWGFNVLVLWAGFGLIGVGLAFALKYGPDRAAEEERTAPLAGTERLLKLLRQHGLDEDELRQFVAKFAGPRWEEFFEALFGFEAKLTVRAALHRGGAAAARERYAAWREPLLYAIDRIEVDRKDAREKELLRAVELARLKAAGMTGSAARLRAEAAADRIVRAAGRIRQSEADLVRAGGLGLDLAPESLHTLTRGSSSPDLVLGPEPPGRLARCVGALVGPHARRVVAGVLLVGCGLWAVQNGMLPGLTRPPGAGLTPLALPGISPALTVWADGFHVGFAGLLLVGSLFYRGHLMGAFVLLGAAVVVAGHHCGIRTVGPLRDQHVALMLGSVLTLVGYRSGTRAGATG